jgi:DNA-binding GntR family transcriptional regulator
MASQKARIMVVDYRRELIEAKTEFYAVLTAGCGNQVVQQFLVQLHNQITLLRATSMTQPGRIEKSIEELRGIWHAIAARDGTKAEWACVNHIEQAAKIALKVLAEQEQENWQDSAEQPPS